MKEIKQTFQIKEFDSLDELNSEQQLLLAKAKEALQYSYSPYSNFKVGCAILLENGSIVLGSNQENASFPAGICAERVAVSNAVHQYDSEDIVSMAITVKSDDFEVSAPIAPCGVCRQVLLESELKQNQEFTILLQGSEGKIYEVPSAKSLLPLYFFEDGLKKG